MKPEKWNYLGRNVFQMNWYSKGEFEKQILAQVNSHLEGVNPSERASALFQISEKIIKLAEEYEDEEMEDEEF